MSKTITIETLTTISKSKGWGRYRVLDARGPIVRSSTGNDWVSGDKTGETDADEVTLVMQVQETTKSGKRYTWTQETRLIVDPSATCEVEYRPGAQRMTLRIVGARLGAILGVAQ